jgi:hypothetical protein
MFKLFSKQGQPSHPRHEHQRETDDDDPANADPARNTAPTDGAFTEYTPHTIPTPQEHRLPPIRAQTGAIAAGAPTKLIACPPGARPICTRRTTG